MMAMTLCWLDLEKINITSEVTDEGTITFNLTFFRSDPSY